MEHLNVTAINLQQFTMDEFDNNECHVLLRKLQELNCSFVYDVDSIGVKEILFKPGEPRMKIFEWLLMSISSFEFVKFQRYSKTSNKTSFLQYFSKILCDLGYYEEDVLPIIQGTASLKFQTRFFNSILDVLIYKRDLIRNSSNDSSHQAMKTPDFQYSKFIGTILENRIEPNFMEEIPLDVRNVLEKAIDNKGSLSRSKTKVSSKTSINFEATFKNNENTIEGLNTQIQAINADLKMIPSTTYPTEEANINIQVICKRLSNNSSTYSNIYKNEILPICKPREVELSELGPACCSLRKAIDRLNNIKQTILQLQIFFEAIQKHYQSIKQLSETRGSYSNPDGWIHDDRVFQMEFIRILKQLVSSPSDGQILK